MKKLLVVPAVILAFPAAALATPDFGVGNSSGGPHDANSHCHPPGQTVERPGCK